MDRYLLSSQVFVEFFKRSDPAILAFLVKLDHSQVYVSTLTLGIVRSAIEEKPASERRRFDRYFRDGVQAVKGGILPVEQGVTDQWSSIRPMAIRREAGGEFMGEDEKLILATAMDQGMIYLGKQPVTDPDNQLEALGLMTRDPWTEPLP